MPNLGESRITPRRTGNSLVQRSPALATQWHPTRNQGLSAADVPYQSGQLYWWVCPAGHEWQARPVNRHRQRTIACPHPECGGHCATAATNLATLRPDLALEWHPTRNALRPVALLPPSWWRPALLFVVNCAAQEVHRKNSRRGARSGAARGGYRCRSCR